MSELDLPSLLAPVADDVPCGADLEYDAEFIALQEAAAGKPEREFDKVYPAEPPDWEAVREHALALAARTRDLRIGVWLVRSGGRTGGFKGVADGLSLLAGWIDRYWDDLHPKLDPGDGNDPTTRINILSQLGHAEALADVRAAGLVPTRGAVTVREIELAYGRADPMTGESVPTVAGLAPAVAALLAQAPGLAAAMTGALENARAMKRALDDRLGAAQSPDLGAFIQVLQSVAKAAQASQGAAAGDEAVAGSGAAVASAAAASGVIQSREVAIRALDRVCEWIERNEPSHPAPLLIHRARRLMNKNFMEIISDLVPDGMGQIEKLAGSGRD